MLLSMLAKEAKVMLINKIDWTFMNTVPVYENKISGDIYYELSNGNNIKLGTYSFDVRYRHVDINIGDICKIGYEPNNGNCAHNYWFKSQYVMDRYHGGYRDTDWVIDMFKSVTPYTDDINSRLISFIEQAINQAECGQLGREAV
jgi:hypothetical protein